jgi:hypothetical protein
VNNRGDIVGFYADAQDQLHGFLPKRLNAGGGTV